jgi:DNA-binding LacI/PurR family transcriptional regulator
MSVTIRDIARRAGVSVSTASRALNRRSDVSKSARTEVLAAAREMNYAVNLHARALAGATSKTLGFILYDSSTAFHASMTRGVEDTATARGYSMIVCNTGGLPDVELRAHQMLREKRVDGLLINSVQSGSAPLQRLMDDGVPFVLLNRRVDGLPVDYVAVDYEKGAYLAAAHLLQLGHRRILMQMAQRSHPPVQDRLRGYRQALEDFGVPFDPALVVYCEDEATSAYANVREVMGALRPFPTAILSYNDLWASAVLKALHDLALRVPDDVAVVGHNDNFIGRFLIPPLSTVSHPVYEMGCQGAEILFRKLAWPEDVAWTHQHVTLQPKLIIRESSGRPAPVAAAVAA